MVQSWAAIVEESTVHWSASPRTVTPTSASIATVISMCGMDGSGGPLCRRSSPCRMAAPDSNNPLTNWLEADASNVTVPPRSCPAPWTVKGRWSPVTSAPRSRSACSIGVNGRAAAWASALNRTSACDKAATGGRKRITVPASPQSMSARSGVGPRSTTSCWSSMRMFAPSARRPSIIKVVSRASSQPVRVLRPPPRAARTSARLVMDFEPGMLTVASKW